MSEPIKVLVCGALGRMGREVVKAVSGTEGMAVVAGVDVRAQGEDVGEAAGIEALQIAVTADLSAAITASRPEVAVDFTAPSAVMESIRTCLRAGVSPVVGTTGLSEAALDEVSDLAQQYGTPCLIAPNFAIGAVLMMKFAQMASRVMHRAEIIEMHHDQKADAPSGTAMRTAQMMVEARGADFEPPAKESSDEPLPGVCGGRYHGITVHSVRLPGYVASQMVVFGGLGQTLTIRHDTTGRDSFMPGVITAISKVRSLKGLVIGLENLLD